MRGARPVPGNAVYQSTRGAGIGSANRRKCSTRQGRIPVACVPTTTENAMSRPAVTIADQTLTARIVEEIARAPNDTEVSVVVRRLDGSSLVEIKPDDPFPATSTIKLAILISLAEAFDAGRLAIDQPVSVSPDDKVAGSGVINWLHDGLVLTLDDLAWLMIAISDNTASNLLIDRVGFDAVRATCARLGASRSVLNRHFMRPADPNLVTAADLVLLLSAIAVNRAASPERCSWMRRLLADQQLRDRLARRLPDDVEFAGKSGWQDAISHDCGLLTGPGGTVAVAVLTRGFTDPHEAAAFIGRIGTLTAGFVE